MCKKSCGALTWSEDQEDVEHKEEEEEGVSSGGIYLKGFLRNLKMSKQT